MSSNLQLYVCEPQSVVAPSGECLWGRGRNGVVCRWNCVVHSWPPRSFTTTFTFTMYRTLLCIRAVKTVYKNTPDSGLFYDLLITNVLNWSDLEDMAVTYNNDKFTEAYAAQATLYQNSQWYYIQSNWREGYVEQMWLQVGFESRKCPR